MTKEEKNSFGFIFLFLILSIFILLPLTSAMSSSNYQMNSYVISDGGLNTTSTNYQTDFVLNTIAGNLTSSFYRSFLGFFYASSTNIAPNDATPVLVSVDGTNQTLSDLNCSSLITDDNSGDSLDVTVQWIKNDELNLTLDYNNSYVNATMFSAILESENTTKTDNWTCSLRLYDGKEYSNWVNSSALEILNTLPTVTLTSPENYNITTNRTQLFTWNGNDADEDSLTYQINITLYASSLCSDIVRNDSGISVENYMPNPFMNCLSDNNDYYNWTVRASDDGGSTYGDWAEERRIDYQSYILAPLINDSVSFGGLQMEESVNTTDEAYSPFVIRNDGNSLVNVSINATDLWNTQANPSTYFQYKIDNVTSEEGSFNWALSNTLWTQVPDATQELGIALLNWVDETDSAEIDLLVEVPANEGSGNRESTMNFEASLAE